MSIDPQPHESESKKERESYWSIDKEDRLNFSFWFSLIFLVGFWLLCWYHICHQNKSCTLIAFVSIAKALVPTGLVAFTLTFIGFEVRDAIERIKLELDRYSKKRKEKQLKKGRQEVLDWIAKEYPDIDHPFE